MTLFLAAYLPAQAAIYMILAKTADTQVDPLTWLIYNAGSLGLVFFLMLIGQLHPKYVVQRLEKENAQQAALIAGFMQSITGNALPALAKTAEALEARPDPTEQLAAQIEQFRTQASDLISRIERGGKP